MIYDAEDNKEEGSSGNEGESLTSKSLESSDNKDEENDRTGAEYINEDGYGDVDRDGRSDSNTGAGGGSAEWLRFLSLGA